MSIRQAYIPVCVVASRVAPRHHGYDPSKVHLLEILAASMVTIGALVHFCS